MTKIENIKNEKSCLNFVWCFNFDKFGLRDKIISNKPIEIEDMILNTAKFPNTQNLISWALNYPGNPFRLVFHFLNGDDNLKDKCREAFDRFKTKLEQERKKRSENSAPVEIVEFKDLCDRHLDKEDIDNNPILKDLLEKNNFDMASKIDSIKLFLNYFAFGYEQNFIIDMDHTPKSIGEGGKVENFDGADLKFSSTGNAGKEGLTKVQLNDLGNIYARIENNLSYTKSSRNQDIKDILDTTNIVRPNQSDSLRLYEMIRFMMKLKFTFKGYKENFLARLKNEENFKSDVRGKIVKGDSGLHDICHSFRMQTSDTIKESIVFLNSQRKEGAKT